VSLPTLIYNLENFIDLSWLIFHYDIFMCGLAAHVLYADKISVCNLSWFFQIYIFCLQLCTDNRLTFYSSLAIIFLLLWPQGERTVA